MGWSCFPEKGDLCRQGRVGKVPETGVLVLLLARRPQVAILKFCRCGCLSVNLLNSGVGLDGLYNFNMPFKQLLHVRGTSLLKQPRI